jgi:hypothetical protein
MKFQFLEEMARPKAPKFATPQNNLNSIFGTFNAYRKSKREFIQLRRNRFYIMFDRREVNRMKKMMIWAMALVFSLSVSLAFAAEEKKAEPAAAPKAEEKAPAEKAEKAAPKKKVKKAKKVKKEEKKEEAPAAPAAPAEKK